MAKFLVRNLFSMKQKRFFTASATISPPLSTSPPSSAAQSAECALDSAISDSENVADGKRAEKLSSFFSLFRDYGFEDSQIQKLIESGVSRLNTRNLKPKIDCLVDNGFTGKLLHKLIVSGPYILLGSLDTRMKPNFLVLKQYLDSDEKVVTVINRSKWFLNQDLKVTFIPNIKLLINEGVPFDRISYFLLLEPRALTQSRDRMTYAVKTVKESGIKPNDRMFVLCLRYVCKFSESNLKKKLEVFKSLGYSDEQVLNVFKKCPTALGLSEETLRSKMWFYLNTVELELETVIDNPLLLSRSVELIRARYEVLKILKSEKLITGARMATVASLSEKRFLRKYVTEHEESVPGLLDMYYGIANKGRNKKGANAEP